MQTLVLQLRVQFPELEQEQEDGGVHVSTAPGSVFHAESPAAMQSTEAIRSPIQRAQFTAHEFPSAL